MFFSLSLSHIFLRQIRRKPEQVQGCCIMLLFCCSCSQWQVVAAARVFQHDDIMQFLSFCGHWWRHGIMQCLKCSEFISNPCSPFPFRTFSDLLALLTLEVCKTNPEIEDLPIKSAKSTKSKVKSLWQLHANYLEALGNFYSQLLSSGTQTNGHCLSTMASLLLLCALKKRGSVGGVFFLRWHGRMLKLASLDA